MKVCESPGCESKSLRNSVLCMGCVKNRRVYNQGLEAIKGGDWAKLRAAARKALADIEAAKVKPGKWRPFTNAPYEGAVIHQTAVTPRKHRDEWPMRDYQKNSMKDLMKLWEEKLDQRGLSHRQWRPSRTVDIGHGVPPAWTSGYHYAFQSKVKK